MSTVERRKGVKMDYNWISVKDRLPEKSGWYLVFAPTFSSHSEFEMHEGIMFSKFKIEKNGIGTWSRDIEVGYHEHVGGVLYWMPLPIPTEFGHFEERQIGLYHPYNVWVDNETGEKRCLP